MFKMYCCELLMFLEKLIFVTAAQCVVMKENCCELLMFLEKLIFVTALNNT